MRKKEDRENKIKKAKRMEAYVQHLSKMQWNTPKGAKGISKNAI